MTRPHPWRRRASLILGRYHPLMLATGAAGLGAWGGAWEMADWPFWVVNGAAVLCVAAQAFVGQAVVKGARATQEEFKVAVSDQLGPLARELSKMAKEPAAKKKGQLDAAIRTCLAAASGLAGASTRTRATYFRRAQRRNHEAFVPGPSLGRGDPPQSEFVKGVGSIEGDAVWAAAEADQPRFVVDVRTEPPPGWDRDRHRAYRTFITVPVRSGDLLVGLLTVNAVEPGDLTENDVSIMQIIAGLLGTAIGMANSR